LWQQEWGRVRALLNLRFPISGDKDCLDERGLLANPLLNLLQAKLVRTYEFYAQLLAHRTPPGI
jgi:hypothetical protein